MGSIPAWAGQPAAGQSDQDVVRVYPRVGGATGTIVATSNTTGGLSPRGRGNRGR